MLRLLTQKLSAFFIHLLLSILIIGSFFSLVFFVWYPAPFNYVEGVEQIIIILLCIDLVLGPIMTFILYKPGKKGLLGDLVLIIVIQFGAFLYGAQIIYFEKPAYISFSYDQFKTIQLKRIDSQLIKDQSLKNTFFSTPQFVSVKLPDRGSKLLETISEDTKGGKNVYELVQYYQPFKDNFLSTTKNTSGVRLEKLLKYHPEQSQKLAQLKHELQLNDDNLLLLPIRGSSKDIIVIINKLTGEPIQYLLITPWSLL